MGKYTEDSKKLLEYIGGKDNIGAVSHCVTRMRFVLNDPKKADIPSIEKLGSVKGTFTQAGQFQVIIGNTVSDFYNDFVEVSGVSGVSKAEVKAAAKTNQNPLQRIMSALAEIFAPLIPAIIVGGLILGFRNIIDSMAIWGGGHTLVELSQFWAGVDKFLWLIGEAVFHVGIPVGICWSVTKKMGTTEMLGIVLDPGYQSSGDGQSAVGNVFHNGQNFRVDYKVPPGEVVHQSLAEFVKLFSGFFSGQRFAVKLFWNAKDFEIIHNQRFANPNHVVYPLKISLRYLFCPFQSG